MKMNPRMLVRIVAVAVIVVAVVVSKRRSTAIADSPAETVSNGVG